MPTMPPRIPTMESGSRSAMQGSAENPSQAFWTGKRVLVVGNTGFKGSWLSLWLHRLGASVVGSCHCRHPRSRASVCAGPVSRISLPERVTTDIRELGRGDRAVKRGLSSPRSLFHLAAQSLVRGVLPPARRNLRDQCHGDGTTCWKPSRT